MRRQKERYLIVDSSKNNYESGLGFEKVKEILKPSTWGYPNEFETYHFKVSWATFKLLDNQFSFEADKIKSNKAASNDGRISYKKYLTEQEIRSINFFDYSGEKIFRLLELEEDWDRVRSKDLRLVSNRLIKYLNKYELMNNREDVTAELGYLEMMGKFFSRRGIDFILFDPDC